MKNKFFVLILIVILFFAFLGTSEAALPTFDAVNAMLSEIRNALMQTQFAQELVTLLDQLDELRAQYMELVRFHAGWDDFLEVLIGNPVNQAQDVLHGAFAGFGWITPEIEGLSTSIEPSDVRASLERLTGEMPHSDARPYIPFEEAQVIESFRFAQEIRRSGEETRNAARSISEQAQTASPKGAARLQVEAMSQSIVLAQQNQEALAKMLELEATQIEQVSRDEKRLERERLKYMEDAKVYLEGLLNAR